MAEVRGGGERSALTQEEADGESSFNWMVVLRQIGHGHGRIKDSSALLFTSLLFSSFLFSSLLL